MKKVHRCLAAAGLVMALAGSVLAQQGHDTGKPAAMKPAAMEPAKQAAPHGADAGKMTPPAGMTEADMQACMAAATPGKMHEALQKDVGEWQGKTKMWMTPDAQPQMSECVTKVTSMMDGKFIKVESEGEMPGMGPFHGFGVYGFDNVSQKFQGTWIDNCGTGMMTGNGEMSSDGKTLTWSYTYNCPITKKSTTMRQVDTWTGADSKKMEMFAMDPKSNKEFKVCEISYTRTSEKSANATMTPSNEK